MVPAACHTRPSKHTCIALTLCVHNPSLRRDVCPEKVTRVTGPRQIWGFSPEKGSGSAYYVQCRHARARDKDNEIKRLREVARPGFASFRLRLPDGQRCCCYTCKLAYHCHGTGSTPPANTAILATSHIVRIFTEYHSTCICRNWDTPTHLSRQRVWPSLRNLGGGGALACGSVLGEFQFRRLEKKLSTLPTMCCLPFLS